MLWFAIAFLVLVVSLIIWRIRNWHNYWIKRGVIQGKQTFFFGDNLMALKKKSMSEMVKIIYDKFPNERYSGMYNMALPILVIRDPELIKQITVKDFDHFIDHYSLLPDGYSDLWTKNLFALKGEKWRDMRATLSPAFTSSKIKSMMELMFDCADQFTNYFVEHPDEQKVELKDIFTRYANDVIATCAFGVTCDSMKNKTNEFYVMGRTATDFTGVGKIMKFILMASMPKLSNILGFKVFSKEVAEFFTKLVSDTIKLREENNIERPDMIHLLMEARQGRLNYVENQSAEKETGFATVEESTVGKVAKKQIKEITIEDMTAQALIFFFAGFDTVSTLMSFMGYELAINPDIQDKLRQEIDETLQKHGGKITYEAVNKMKYLDMITAETLRKWPAATAVDRVCNIPYTIPPSNPNEKSFTLQKGESIWLPVWALHHDPNYYPNPDKFDPERFSDENKADIKPYTYLPFGSGPRNCIGSRFALLESKTVFVSLLSKFEIVVNEKTQIPLVLSHTSFNLNAADGFWVSLKPRNK